MHRRTVHGTLTPLTEAPAPSLQKPRTTDHTNPRVTTHPPRHYTPRPGPSCAYCNHSSLPPLSQVRPDLPPSSPPPSIHLSLSLDSLRPFYPTLHTPSTYVRRRVTRFATHQNESPSPTWIPHTSHLSPLSPGPRCLTIPGAPRRIAAQRPAVGAVLPASCMPDSR